MKNITTVVLIGLLVLFNVSLCNAGYEIIDQSHHIWGEIGGETGYDDSGPSPLSNIFTNSIGEVYGDTDISSWFWFDRFYCNAVASINWEYEGTAAYSEAEITTIFEPYGNSFEIHTSLGTAWGYGAESFVRITDQTIGSTVFFASSAGGSDPDGIYSINPDHIHELYVKATAPLGDYFKDYNFAVAEVYFYVIPEPSTLLLLGVGAVMMRRKRRG